MNDSSKPMVSQLSQQNRETMQQYQKRSLQELLRYVWKYSSFYRDYYGSHGIKEKDLPEISIGDLPFLSKQTLMENFDRTATDPRIKRGELERWIQDNRDPRECFWGDFIVVHSSGSSGTIGIFVYDRKGWRFADSAMAELLATTENHHSARTRAAFYLASHGHFVGVSIAASMPKTHYDTLILSMLDSRERVVEQLNAFQPHRLHGYASSLASLAELALRGGLCIHPQTVFVSGEKLTGSMERAVRDAWKAPIYNLYASSESKYIAIGEPGEAGMRLLDDLNIVEVLNETNEPVLAGGEGRVVLTNLYNYTLPIIRYELGDYVVQGTSSADSPFKTIREIRGRLDDALPVVLYNGKRDEIHPIVLTTFYVPALERVQFVSERPERVRIDYVAAHNIDTAVQREFQQMLDLKSATRTTFEVRRVREIPNDPQTGKLRLVKIEHDQKHRPSRPSTELAISFVTSTTAAEEKQDNTIYKIVRNHGKQYSLWPADKDNPVGWRDAGKVGSKADCVAYIRKIWSEARPPHADYPKDKCVHQLFEEQATRTPSNVAVIFEEQVLTYYELNARANQLAHYLRGLGVGPETLVPICVGRSLDMVVGILGILKAGGAWLPLDPAHPKDRQQRVFKDARVVVLLTQKSLAAELPEHGVKTVLLDSDWASISKYSKSNPENISTPTNLAYTMYTSGSTGQPKGVMITHANLCHYVGAMRQALGIGPKDIYLHTATIAFSSSVRQLMVPLTLGASNVIAKTDEIRQPLELLETVKRQRVTILDIVPSYWRNCIHALTGLDVRTRNVLLDNHLRLILATSEPLLPDLTGKWTLELKHAAQFINLFGQTETTGSVTTYPVPTSGQLKMKTVPIGGPVANTRIHLLDTQQRPVPVGEVGEIYVEGASLGRGYLNQPELTAERFVPNPFTHERGGRMYKTGDLARYRPDGNIEFVGRIDHQVKIRGIRIEAGEIEAVLAQHPGVRESVVTAREDKPDNKRLVAYVVPREGWAPVSGELLRRFLKEKLPDYMIPSVFVMLSSLPLTPNGKVYRKALPVPDQAGSDVEKSFVAPRTPIEKLLAEIWAEVLRLERVGIHDNFFDLGAHSLMATQIISRVRDAFQAELPLRSLFENPTVASLAVQIAQAQAKTVVPKATADMLADLESLSDEEAQLLFDRQSHEEI